MSATVLSLYALDPAMPVLLRLDGAVQVGWDPRRAVLVRRPVSELRRQATGRGLKDADGLSGRDHLHSQSLRGTTFAVTTTSHPDVAPPADATRVGE